MRIFIIGDSITQGYYDTEGGWATRIFREFSRRDIASKKYDAAGVFNMGIDGDDAPKVLKRLDVELRARSYYGHKKENVAIFALGTNDSLKQGDKFIETPAEFAENLAKIVTIAKKYADNIIFCAAPPCDDKLMQPTPWNDEIFYYNDRIVEFNAVTKKFCAQNNFELIDVYDPFAAAMKTQELLEDGLHPNDAGHELIYQIVMGKLEEGK